MLPFKRFSLGFLLACYLLFSGMTCEGNIPINDLNTPKDVSCIGDNNVEAQIKINFWAYNNESISGYNVYIDDGTNFTTWATAKIFLDAHMNADGLTNDYYTSPFIVSRINSPNVFPTITSDTAHVENGYYATQLASAASKYTEINYLIVRDGSEVAIADGTYYIGVTAVDQNNGVESKLSNLIKATWNGGNSKWDCADRP